MIEELRKKYPAVLYYAPDLCNSRIVFLIRSDGKHVLMYDCGGKAYCLSIQYMRSMKPTGEWQFYLDDGYLTFYNGIDVYTVGPWLEPVDGWKLGSIHNLITGCKVGSGPEADTLPGRTSFND